MNKEPIIFFNFMGFRNFGKTQLGKYSANFNWEGMLNGPCKVWLMPCAENEARRLVPDLFLFFNKA